MKTRTVDKVIRGKRVTDGAGVQLVRSLGTEGLEQLDPFLMLDEFRSDTPGDYIAGFPDHPHRGFETVTYMLAGLMEHADNHGNRGVLRGGGGVQWMTAGRGIIHSEMPKQKDGLIWGFQLWVNLPAADKMMPPRYQNIEPEDVPLVKRADGALVRVIAGEADGATGPVRGVVTAPLYLDVTLPPGGVYEHGLPDTHSAFAYLFQGSAKMGGTAVQQTALAALGDDGDGVRITAGPEGARFLLLAAKKLNEPVARYGPFVMNTQKELKQAFEDYRSGNF
ncbi:MAG: pirin family protein [Nitrospinae bacterium]|nr:pirin family protein [Nitrospinota bacterium]